MIEQALDLYKGPFLGTDSGHPWALSPRERLRRRFLRGITQLAGDRERAGEWREATAWYERGIGVDELAEEFHQRLMVCHQRLGRRAEALAVYGRCCRALAAGLGVAPSAETEALYRAIRAESAPMG